MASLIVNTKNLPERKSPIPGSKPSVDRFPHGEMEHAEEADQFRELIREIPREQVDLSRSPR
jgi:hypothetical protein